MRVEFVQDNPAIKRVRFYPQSPAEVITKFLRAVPADGKCHGFPLPTSCKGGCWLPVA